YKIGGLDYYYDGTTLTATSNPEFLALSMRLLNNSPSDPAMQFKYLPDAQTAKTENILVMDPKNKISFIEVRDRQDGGLNLKTDTVPGPSTPTSTAQTLNDAMINSVRDRLKAVDLAGANSQLPRITTDWHNVSKTTYEYSNFNMGGTTLSEVYMRALGTATF